MGLAHEKKSYLQKKPIFLKLARKINKTSLFVRGDLKKKSQKLNGNSEKSHSRVSNMKKRIPSTKLNYRGSPITIGDDKRKLNRKIINL